ncbi:HAMP domain-containing sensor histidine kinase [Sulfurospirillum sp. 1612]|uniref:HAMP domain-containing sensor histidine kinase n=1 Tax=Sulfurospirillum sp. 1612 TaxID=3094835 RepID=UPI002F945249
MKFKSLKTRVLLWFGSIVALLLILFSFSFYYFYNKSINLSLETRLYNQARYLHETVLPHLKKGEIIDDDRYDSLQIAIVRGDDIVNQTKKFHLKHFDTYLNATKPFTSIADDEHMSVIYDFKFQKPFEGDILLYQKEIDDKAENVVDTLLVLNPILLLVLLFLGHQLIEKVLVPIRSVTQIAKNVSVTNFATKIPLPKGEHELKDLVDSFNTMTDRLKEGVEKIDRFNSDVSHELKTPLTVIKGEIEVSLKKKRTSEYYQQTLHTIFDAAHQIQRIIDDLLFLTKFSKKNIKTTYRLSDLDAILLKTVDKYAPIAAKKSIKIHLDRLEPVAYLVNPLLIERIFSNLLDNAIKYTPCDKNIHLSIYQDNQVHFKIEDEGIGIAEKFLAKITDRFFRVDASRNKSIDGFGIGLSIVENCVNLHDGTLKITSKEGVGTTVEVLL